jgi:hypothetical protein
VQNENKNATYRTRKSKKCTRFKWEYLLWKNKSSRFYYRLICPKPKGESLSESDENHLIEMAWQDRLLFDIIFSQWTY